MTTTTIVDVRRSDLRTNLFYNPYWITSAEVGITADDKVAICFSFPATDYQDLVLVHMVGCQIVTAWSAGTVTLDVGLHTLATDAVTTDGLATLVDADEYVPTADITYATPAMYWPDGGNWFDAFQADTNAAPVAITPADTTVPAIGVMVTSTDTLTTGALRVHMLISQVPLV